MELFKITCVTCQAGLSVRNEALLGQIVACPRCGSMVEVAAPTSVVDSVAASAAPASARSASNSTDNGALATDAAPADSAAAGAVATDSEKADSAETDSVKTDSATGGSATIGDPGRQACETTGESAVPAGAAVPSGASAEALQASAAVTRYQWMVWSLASFSIGAAVVVVVLLTRGDSSAETTANAPSALQRADAQSPTELSPSVTRLPSPDEDTATLPAIVDAPPIEAPQEDVPVKSVLGGDNAAGEEFPRAVDRSPLDRSALDRNIEAQPFVDPAQQPAAVVAVESPSDTTSTSAPPSASRLTRRSDRLGVDPLDWDPASLTLATVGQPVDQSIMFTESPEPDPEPPAAQLENPDEFPSTVPLVRRGPSDGPGDAKSAGVRDAAGQLALLIPSLKVDRLPLVDCLRLFSQLSGVPVSVAPEQLLMAGITPQELVSLDASETGLSEMLTQVLTPLRLEYQTRGAQVVVVRQAATKVREISYPVDDLLSASTSEAELAGWVQQMVAPESWQAVNGQVTGGQSAGGKGTLELSAGSLRISQTQQVQYQVLIMLERFRLASNLPPRSRYPVERLAGTPAQHLLGEKLAASTTFTFSRYTALDDIFVHWQTELGVPLLVDWPALAEADTWPETTVTCAIIDEPWGVALEKVLEPLGLGWRAVTGGAIEITSADKVQNEPLLEIYSLRAGANRSVPELAPQLAKLWKPPPAPGSLACDSTGRVLLVYQPAAKQRLVWDHLQKIGLLGDQ